MNKRFSFASQTGSAGIAVYAIAGSLLLPSGEFHHLDFRNCTQVTEERGYLGGMTSPSASNLAAKLAPVTDIGDAALSRYYENFSDAIDEYKNGELIRVPAGLQTAEQFFEWLQSV